MPVAYHPAQDNCDALSCAATLRAVRRSESLASFARSWGSAMESDMASLRVFMVSLRKKLAKGGGRQYLQTHVGIGYRLG